jgi:predicted porin
MLKLSAFILASLLSLSAHSGVSLNTTLGSLVGEVAQQGVDGVMPFNAIISYDTDVGGVRYSALCGHQSTADANGGEYDGEYCGVGVGTSFGRFYGTTRLVEFLRNSVGDTSNPVFYIEAGVKDDNSPFRVGAFFQESNLYNATGILVGYTFEVIK